MCQSDRSRRTHSRRTLWLGPWPLCGRHAACVVAADVAGSVVEDGAVAGDGAGVADGAVAGGGGAGVGLDVVGVVVVVAGVADVWRLTFVGAPNGLRSPLATRFLYRLSPFP